MSDQVTADELRQIIETAEQLAAERQADYDTRAALVVAPAPLAEALQVPEVRALVDALDCGINQYREMREVNSAFYDAARATLAKIKGTGHE